MAVNRAQVTGLNHRGEGVGRVLSGPDKGLVVFLQGTAPGDVVEYVDLERKKGFLRGKVTNVIESGPGRVEEVCPVAKDCGGCAWQHLDYDLQLEWKRRIVEEAFARIAKIRDLEICPCIPSPRVLGYRNKVEVPLTVTDGKVVAGFFRPYTHQVVSSEDCPLEHPLAREVVSAMIDVIRQKKYSVYNEKTGRGLVRHVVSRVAPGTGERMAVLVINGQKLPNEAEFARELAERLRGLKSVALNINMERTNIILGRTGRILGGKPYIEDLLGSESLGHLKFRISPQSFYQVNSEQAVRLYEEALDAAQIGADDVVYDVYSGIGTITLFAAKRASHAVGIEEVAPAVEDARKNAEINGITNVSFIDGQAERVLPALSQGVSNMRDSRGRTMRKARFGRPGRSSPGVVILDPPRAGAEERALTAISKFNPRSIVYVSCNPATLARDLITLGALGWKPTYCQPIDMFPMTPHVETVCLMSKV